MALPRPLARLLKTGQYKPSPIGKKARETAKRLRERDEVPPPPPPSSFDAIKRRMNTKKQLVHGDNFKFDPRASRRVVNESEAYDEMVNALEFTNDQMDEYASKAAKAWRIFDETGDAGELSMYLAYDFLWYH